MKKIVFVIILSVITPVCFSKNNDESLGGNTIQNSQPILSGLDLAGLTFKENIQSIYKQARVNAIPS